MFWTVKILTTLIALAFTWRIFEMTSEMILNTPSEFLPALVIIGLIIGGIPVLIRAMAEFNDLNKNLLRNNEITEKLSYGLDYAAANIGVIVVAVLGAVIIPGYICDAASIEPTDSAIYTIGFIWSIIVGISGCKTFTAAIDVFRDSGKISDLESEIATAAAVETATATATETATETTATVKK